MTGALSWESILEYVSCYNPLDSGTDACAGFASSGFASSGLALSALLSGHTTAEYGYLGYLVLLIHKQGNLGLRTSVVSANLQKGLGAVFRVFLVYMAKFRMGLARMTLYTYATFISLLWVSPSKRSYRRLFLLAQLSTLTAGYAGEGSTTYVFRTQLVKAEKKSQKKPEKPKCPKPPTIIIDPPPTNICCRGANGPMNRLGCTCHRPGDRLVGCIAPPATARESCVCSFFLGEQYNWRPHVCPILGGEAPEGLRTCCSPESSCTKKDNRGNSPEPEEKNPETKGPEGKSVQQENTSEMRNRIRKKLFAAKLPGAILGTVLAAVFSTEIFIKISTAVTIISYNLFFWMGAQFYDLCEMENDVTNEKKSGAMEKNDKKDKEKIDGKDAKQIPEALVLPELKKAVEVVLKLLPLWLTFASTCYLVNATADTFFMEQVDYLENNSQSQSFKIPRSLFYSFPDLVSTVTEKECHCLIEQYQDENKKRWARLLRISTGMLFSSLCCIVASLVARRLDYNYNSASMLWLLPQFFLWGMIKGILEEGVEEFLHDHLDNDLQVQAVIGIADGVGNLLSMILTAASPSSWLGSGNDISKSHLEYYYRMLAIITLSSTFMFTIVAVTYELREKEDTGKSGKRS